MRVAVSGVRRSLGPCGEGLRLVGALERRVVLVHAEHVAIQKHLRGREGGVLLVSLKMY